MDEQMKTRLAKMALNGAMNGLRDHYDKSGSNLSHDNYWRTHLRITGSQTVDDYLMTLINPCIDYGLTEVDEIVATVKQHLAL